jgi:hypothetical protein
MRWTGSWSPVFATSEKLAIQTKRFEAFQVAPNAGDMLGEIALAIEMGADAVDIGKTIHPHPTLGESIGMAAEVAHGSCTDLPPARK